MTNDDCGGFVICRPPAIPFKVGSSQGITLMSDLHVGSSSVDYRLIDSDLKTAADNNDRILINGDVLDMILCCDKKRFIPGVLHSRLQGRADIVNKAIEWSAEILAPYAHLIDMIGVGNHECHSDDTEVLTDRGWVLFSETNMNDQLATLDMEVDEIVYQKPTAIHSYDYDGWLYYYRSTCFDFAVTPNHRLINKPAKDNYLLFEDWRLSEAKNAPAGIAMPVSGSSRNQEYSLTDDQIRIVAWVLTDGHVSKPEARRNVVCIYQRPSKMPMITAIADRLKASYRMYQRSRKIMAICGRELRKPPEDECRMMFRPSFRDWVRSVIPPDKSMPKWVFKLTNRQFGVFLSSIVDGDGSRHVSAPDTSWMVYGQKPFLDQLQAACISHNWRASLSIYRNKHYRLNVVPGNFHCISNFARDSVKKPYKGKVWCATVPNGTLVTRRNGKVLISGNSAVEKYHSTDVIYLLIEKLQASLSKKYERHVIYYGGYMGFVDYRFRYVNGKDEKLRGNGRRYVIFYHHGGGGSAPVTRGIIDLYRKSSWVDADCIWEGHKHTKLVVASRQISCPQNGEELRIKEVAQIRTGAYLRTYEAQSQASIKKHGRRSSWAADQGFAPQGLGAIRLVVEFPTYEKQCVRIIQ